MAKHPGMFPIHRSTYYDGIRMKFASQTSLESWDDYRARVRAENDALSGGIVLVPILPPVERIEELLQVALGVVQELENRALRQS